MTALLDEARAELAPSGTLRAGINRGNIVLVTGSTPEGDPTGVAPDMARHIAERLGVPLSYVSFASPGEVADAVGRDACDIALIAIEPARSETIAFSPPYVEIEATYLVPAGSPLHSVTDLDRPGVRIAVSDRSAYDLYLSRTLKHAELYRAKGLPGAFRLFVEEGLEALAGLRPALIGNAAELPGARLLEGCFTSIRQAIGTRPGKKAGAAFLDRFVAEAITSGLVARLLERHGVAGKLSVSSRAAHRND
jgi:polar amino acid transport system substrate-binding protein